MISHKYKCIFVHLPRTAGTSIEQWIHGRDWWEVEPNTKHLIASQAKRQYADYWDEYFTFAFVRNPWDRVVSSLKFPDYFGIEYREKVWPFQQSVLLDGYKSCFGGNVVLEHDFRFFRRSHLLSKKHASGQVYGNILDEDLDFVGRFENLSADCRKIREIL